MDFARKILQNYGWKEGDGLGKNKTGIAKPLKATLKFDNAGFGANQASADFNNHWWERVFNEAATNVNVSHDGEKVKMSLKDDDNGVEISTKGYSMKKLKKLKKNREENSSKIAYDNFMKASTLTNLGDEVDNPDKINANDIEVSKVNVLTDEELFKACGGRTAHKGARHGLKLSGKLSRIEQQEAELLAKIMAKRESLIDNKSCNNDIITKPEKSSTNCSYQNEGEVVKETSKKKKKRHCEETTNEAKTNSELAVASKKKKVVCSEADVDNNVPKDATNVIVKDVVEPNSSKKSDITLEEKNTHKKKKEK